MKNKVKKPQKVIVAQYVSDWVQPDVGKGIPVVISSNHPDHQIGDRFDYGFLKIALTQGYTVIIFGKKGLGKDGK